MNKDIIYIDVDDDITAIIGKIKTAKSKVVALVPPKRSAVLQSAVNLRLLARASEQSDKRLVLISANSALTALAAAASIPVARNLQSKPELAPTPQSIEDDGDDIIDGSDLPIGDHARTAEVEDGVAAAGLSSPAVDAVIRENAAEETPRTLPAFPVRASRSQPNKRGVKIPNFGTFRKRLALGVGALILLVVFLVWAIMFAPRATILITARTIATSANVKVELGPDTPTDFKAASIKTVRKQIKKDATQAFDATGTKTVGEKSTGSVIFENCETDDPQTVPSGTGISAGGRTYITQAAATVPGGKGITCSQPGKSAAVTVIAQDIGEEYDAANGTRFSVAGHSNSNTMFYFRATATTAFTGGTKETVTIVSQADVDKAAEQITGQNNDSVKKQLSDQFGRDAVAIDQTFLIDKTGIVSNPAVGQEAPTGKSTLSGSLTFTMLGVEKSEAGRFLDAYFTEQIKDENDQRIYGNGADSLSFVDIEKTSSAYTATLVATAKLGPKIDENALKSEAKGKQYGDVQSGLTGINGIEDVDVKFSPFWVSSVPRDDKRIKIEFKLDETK